MAPKIVIEGTGLIHRNPKPYLRAENAMHPNLMVAGRDEIVAAFDLGQGAESLDYHTVLARSLDQGRTWQLEKRLIDPPAGPRTTHTIRPSLLANGAMLALGAFYRRDNPEEGLLNRDNFGLVRCDLFLIESRDKGRSWTQPRPVAPLPDSPAWEVSHSPLELSSGEILLPLASWPGWDGKLPFGQQTIVLASRDGGKTWPVCATCFDDRSNGLIHWEQCVVEWPAGVLSVAWEFDTRSRTSNPLVFALGRSPDFTFGPPQPTGLKAETCELLPLGAGLLLAVYRRIDQPGLWATVVEVKDGQWRNLASAPLWQGSASRMLGHDAGADELSALKFGSPSVKRLSDGSILVAFWCHEDEISNIRWIRLRVS